MQMPRILILSLVMVATLSLACDANALEVAGVDVPDTATIGAAKEKVTLNGAGIRKKYAIVKVYVGALYLQSKTSDASKAISMPGAKRVYLYGLYKMSAEKLNAALDKGFRSNMDAAKYTAMEPRIKSFMKLFTGMDKGDEAVIDYTPDVGTKLSINGAIKGTIEGEDFFQALLRVWIGDVPADKGLKKGMLGG